MTDRALSTSQFAKNASQGMAITPKSEVRAAIVNGISYENAGVRADGKDYVSLKAYRAAVGGTPTGGSTTGGGGTNDDDIPIVERP